MNIAPSFLLSRLPPEFDDKVKRFFSYTARFVPLAASIEQPAQFTVQSDSAFVMVSANAVVTTVDNLTRSGFVPQLVQWESSGAGRNQFDQATHFHNVYGTAEAPGYLEQFIILEPASTFTVKHTNLEATPRNVWIRLGGFKVWNVAQAARGNALMDILNRIAGALEAMTLGR